MDNQVENEKERLPFGKQIFKLLEDEKEVLDGLLKFADKGSLLAYFLLDSDSPLF